jgi:hypothetical protein
VRIALIVETSEFLVRRSVDLTGQVPSAAGRFVRLLLNGGRRCTTNVQFPPGRSYCATSFQKAMQEFW